MKISYNSPAMRANNALNASDSKVSKSLQRLSSGLKVTVSKDHPSGYAIGRRMNTQITGLGTATQSSNNGISVIETVDGALTEVHEMLQRMNELAVRGETGTLTTSDRMMIDQEVKQLKQEITRISTDTQFNGQTLLDGTFDLRGYTNNHRVGLDYYSDEVIPKKYSIEELTVAYDAEGKIDKDNTTITFASKGDNAFPAGVVISDATKNKITITGPLDFKMTLEIEAPAPGTTSVTFAGNSTATANVPAFNVVYNYNWDISATPPAWVQTGVDEMATTAALQAAGSADIPADAKVSYINSDSPATGDDTIVIANEKGFRMEIVVSPRRNAQAPAQPADPTIADQKGQGTFPIAANANTPVEQSLILDATGIGTMDTQTGANEGQQLAIRIPTISLNRMGLEDIRMRTEDECADANRAIKDAILYVSDVRSRLGAYQNRLEHTINNLAVSTENMTASYSRIMDVDIAEEMTNYTTEQVISQAAVSMVAQANERPSQVLQLLQ